VLLAWSVVTTPADAWSSGHLEEPDRKPVPPGLWPLWVVIAGYAAVVVTTWLLTGSVLDAVFAFVGVSLVSVPWLLVIVLRQSRGQQ
jgi:hypothetical protein